MQNAGKNTNKLVPFYRENIYERDCNPFPGSNFNLHRTLLKQGQLIPNKIQCGLFGHHKSE